MDPFLKTESMMFLKTSPGLYKIYKPFKNGVPFSPDFISDFCCRFSNEYTVKDSFSLAEELSNVDADLVMTSFDIKRYLPISH